MNDDELRELFGEMRDDPVPVDSMARVRMVVDERVRARRRMLGIGWKVAGALAVAGCLTAVMLQVRTVDRAPSPVRAVVETPVIAVEQSAPVETRPAPRPAVRKRVRAAAAHMEEGVHEIRIENPLDPDVVIVLLGGRLSLRSERNAFTQNRDAGFVGLRNFMRPGEGSRQARGGQARLRCRDYSGDHSLGRFRSTAW